MGKKILLSLTSIFLIYQSYKLLVAMHEIEIESIGILILLAWLLNMFVTGIFAFTGFAFPTQKLMLSSYYDIRHPNQLKKLYKVLNVETFRKVLLATFWRSKKQRKDYFDGTKTGITDFITNSKKAEFGHLIPFVILVFVGLYFVFFGVFTFGFSVLAFNILGNFYPIVLQRHHRNRIENILKRKLKSS